MPRAFAAAVILSGLALLAPLRLHAEPTEKMVPRVHHIGDEGYFSVTVPVPKSAPPERLVVTAQVRDGDAYLVHTAQQGQEAGADIIVTGRYGRPGTVKITVSARTAVLWTAAPEPLITVVLDLPGAEVRDAEVMKTWANHQRRQVNLLAYSGGDSFPFYWNSMATARYGLEPSSGGSFMRDRSRRQEPPDLYSVFSGAAAIQESLQLDAGNVRGRNEGGPGAPALRSLASLSAPGVRSHPFDEMLKGRRPRVPALSSYVPADQYALFFSDFNKEIELADLLEEWGGSLLEQFQAEARDFRVRKKLAQQLCLETTWVTRLFGDRVIGAMAFTGNDPFLKEGTDLTVLFALRKKDLFLQHLAKRYADAVSGSGAVREDATAKGQTVMSVSTPDRTISSYAVILGDVAAVSNSREALQKVIGAAEGSVPALASAKDFQYVRTIFPEGDDNEDLFLYLSDPHIRQLVAPRWKIGEAHRMRCAANLQAIANARFWFRSERRREPSLDDLIAGGYLGKGGPVCPDGGTYSIRTGNHQVLCSVHNRTGYLTPLVGIAASNVTDEEAGQYKAFVENYNRYWRQFFDPIGIRVKLGETIRIETCILPLIENSWYDGLVAFSGREAGPLKEESVLPRTILSLRGRMSPEWLKQTGFVREFAERRKIPLAWLGDEISLNLCDGQVLFTIEGREAGFLGGGRQEPSLQPIVFGYLLSALNLPTYLSVKVTDAAEAERAIPWIFQTLFLERSEGLSAEAYALEPYRDRNITVLNLTLFIAKVRLYAAVLGDRLIIASRRDIITDLIDGSVRPEARTGSMEFSIYRQAFREIEPVVNLGYQEDLRHACQKNLALAEALMQIGATTEKDLAAAAFGLRGFEPYCPSGGRYMIDVNYGRAACTVHGTVLRPRQPRSSKEGETAIKLVNSFKRINARLSFTPEGLMTSVEIQRNR